MSERKGSTDRCEVDNHGCKLNGIRSKSQSTVAHQENASQLDKEAAAHNLGERCSVGSESIDNGPSGYPLVGDDIYEQLPPCLPGEFQIPE